VGSALQADVQIGCNDGEASSSQHCISGLATLKLRCLEVESLEDR